MDEYIQNVLTLLAADSAVSCLELVGSSTCSCILHHHCVSTVLVLDPGKGVCADPRRGDTTLGVGGPGPPMGNSEHQLSSDRGGEKT
jgi:hypothetical protein